MWHYRVGLGVVLGLCFFALMLLGRASGREVQCALDPADDKLCTCHRVDSPPWSTEPVLTAPHPETVSVQFDTSNGTHAQISWMQKGNSMRRVKNGFHLELSISPNLPLYYNCDVEIDRLNASIHREIVFLFNDCCKSLSTWSPKTELTVIVHARPMYNIDDNAYHIFGNATVPDTPKQRQPRSRSRKRKNQKNKKKKRNRSKNKKKRKRHHGGKMSDALPSMATAKGDDSTTTYLLIVLSSLATFLVCTVVFCGLLVLYFRRKKGEHSIKSKRKILVVGDTDDRYILFINTFVETLKKCRTSETEITTNVRKTSEIASNGIIHWSSENISHADVVIFVITNINQVWSEAPRWGTEDQSCSHVRVAVGIAKSRTVKNGFRDAKNKYICLDLIGSVKSNSLPFCTLYCLKKGFWDLMEHVLGRDCHTTVCDADKTILQKLAASAKGTPENAAWPNSRPVRTPISGLNDLDESILNTDSGGTEEPLLTCNIPQDQYFSVENNQPYSS